MPFHWKKLLLWFGIVYVVFLELRDLIGSGWAGFQRELELWSTPHGIALTLTGLFAFYCFALFQYIWLRNAYERYRPWMVVAGCFGVMLLGIGLRALLQEGLVYALFGRGNYNLARGWNFYLLDNLYYALTFSAVGIGFYFAQLAQYTEAARRASEQQRLRAEVKFLRNQVNPHFLFNTLNNVYTLVHLKSDAALPALEKLSGLLRYALYERAERVPLERELDYLRDLIHLELLRTPGLEPPEIEVEGLNHTWEIPPLLLVPFVENAFKHGDPTNEAQPLRVRIGEQDGRLNVEVINAIRAAKSKDATGGIGLENVRRRLELLYPNRHELQIADDGTIFCVQLQLMLDPEK